MRSALVAVAALGLAGCFRGDFANCTVICATSADCPGELGCSPQNLCSIGGDTCTVTTPQPVDVTVSGEGTVTSDPAGINCGAMCSADFAPQSSVSLTATPAATSVFEGWTGACSGATSPCSLVVDGPKMVGAEFALHGARRWVKQISFPGQDYLISELEVDANGDVIAAGRVVDAGGMSSLHAIKYAKDTGAVIWEQKIDMPSFFPSVGGLDTDAAGNVYVCSRFMGNGSMTIGTQSVSGDLGGNVLAIRLAAATGAVEWAKTWGGGGQDECDGLAASGTDLFITGYTSSAPSVFGTVTIGNGAVNNAYIVRVVAATGTPSAGKLLAGSFGMFDIAAGNGMVAIAGEFRTTYSIDSCSFSPSGTGTDGMVMNFNPSLTCTWSVEFGSLTSAEDTTAYAIAPMPGGGWAVTGTFEGAVNFAGSGSSIVSRGMFDAFIARYSATGAHVWSFGYGSAGTDIGRAVDVTSTGEVVFAGEFASTITFGTHVLNGTDDAFMTRMTAGNTPVHEWATKVGGTAREFVTGLNLDAIGTLSLLVTWTGMSDVQGVPLTAQDYDAWVGSFVR